MPGSASGLVGDWVYARDHRIGGGKFRGEHRRRKSELARHGAIPLVERIVGWGIYPSRHFAVRWVNRIDGKDVVELDIHVRDGAERRAGRQEPGERRAGNHDRLRRYKVVTRFGFDLAVYGRFRQRGDKPIGIAGAEEEGRLGESWRCDPGCWP